MRYMLSLCHSIAMEFWFLLERLTLGWLYFLRALHNMYMSPECKVHTGIKKNYTTISKDVDRQ